jgi:hypothetical protein
MVEKFKIVFSNINKNKTMYLTVWLICSDFNRNYSNFILKAFFCLFQ